jgi:hypothetical protein
MSPRFSLSKQDAGKIAKGAGIAAGGAVLTYLLSELPNIDFGQYTPIVVALLSIIINASLKFIQEHRSEIEVTVRPISDDEIE